MKGIRNGLLMLLLAAAFAGKAQPQEMLDIAARYPGENAVILNKSEHFILKFNDKDQLTASSEVAQEILLLTDLAPGIFNTSDIYHSSFHELLSWTAASHIPNKRDYKTIKATALKSTNLKTDNVFYDDSKVTVIGFSGLVKMATIETNYVIEHKDLNFMKPFYFQTHLPVVQSVFRITAPKSVNVKVLFENIDSSFLIAATEEHKNTITYTWTARNVNRYKAYDNGPSFPAGIPHVIPNINKYSTAAKENITLISDPESLYKYLYQHIKNINRAEIADIKSKVTELTAACTSDRCKAEKIYNWVQDNIRYVAFEDSLGGYIPREAEWVFQRKYGDCKDMTSLLVAMCRAAGLQASFTWIGTRERPYAIKKVPLPLTFNHMICAWNDNGKWVFMDGTHSTIRFGVPPYALQGKDALIGIDETRYDIVTVEEIDAARNTNIDSTWISINEQNEVEGKLKISMTGYPEWAMKSVLRYSNESDNEKTIKSLSSRASNKFFQKSGRYESKNDQINFYSEFSIKDYVQRTGKELYINLNLQRYNSDQKIEDIKQRKLPIMNNFKATYKEVVCLKLPKGYQVSYLPPDTQHYEPGLWGYKVSYTQKDNQVICVKEFLESALYISPNEFAMNNRLSEELNEQYKETVILKAIEP